MSPSIQIAATQFHLSLFSELTLFGLSPSQRSGSWRLGVDDGGLWWAIWNCVGVDWVCTVFPLPK